jgi:ribokinase
MDQIDFLAIGDIVTEPFIRLHEASVHCKINTEECEICMRWGDKIPYEYFVLVPAVGNASNAAVSAARLGLQSSLRAYLGSDQYGEQCLEVLKKETVDTSLMVVDPARPTNYHYVLWYETERTILVKHEEYDYTVPEMSVAPKWVYLSSLAANSLQYHLALIEWFKKFPDMKLAFQPGTFQMKLGADTLKEIYQRTDIFFCNKEEAERILKIEPTADKKELLKKLLADIQTLGPKIAVITDDRRGAYAMDADKNAFHIPMYPDQPEPFERTGAGDAFASSVTAALALGVPLQEALLWGPVNAMSVVTQIGAQRGLLSREKLEEYLKNAPADYKLTAL